MNDAPSSNGSTTTGPATFAEAFAADASSASTPSTPESPTASASAGTTAPPVETPSPEGSTPQPGEPPKERWADILANARQKAADEAKAEWQGYEWAKNPQVQQIVQQIAQSQGDPLTFFAHQFSELSKHPVYGPQLRTFLGQQFGALRQSRSAAEMPEPDIAVYDNAGNVVGKTYSDAALAQRDAFLKQQLLSEVQSQIAPKLQTLDQINAERQAQAAEAKAQSFATSFMSELSALPGFDLKKHGPAIAAELKAFNLPDNAHPAEVNAAAYRAYAKVVLPTLNADTQSRLLDNLKQQAAASTATNPANTGGGSRANVTSFHDKSLVWR